MSAEQDLLKAFVTSYVAGRGINQETRRASLVDAIVSAIDDAIAAEARIERIYAESADLPPLVATVHMCPRRECDKSDCVTALNGVDICVAGADMVRVLQERGEALSTSCRARPRATP